MVHLLDNNDAYRVDFQLFDQLVLMGLTSVQDKLLPLVEDVDPTQPIGKATLWGMPVPIFRHRVAENGMQLVVADSAAGMRWMRADFVHLTGQAPLTGPKLKCVGVFLLKA
ncbi:hypothetical protein [Hymenobacter jeollabukensis]|uniref:Uncharacterized protein n=1 Tax=Hymenobacter jeollabukensis TaxID=2025313 RepID=A0A5R8WJ49_9BACT|nr:hypothetical protein [Hymenobacter jeollabukensis]TLM88805.1 hypothetical protein FDY95_23510 [Hymenobacter jeollabukensis]